MWFFKRIFGWPVWPGCGTLGTPGGWAHRFGWHTPCRRGCDHRAPRQPSLCFQSRSCSPAQWPVASLALAVGLGNPRQLRLARCGRGGPGREVSWRRARCWWLTSCWCFHFRRARASRGRVWSGGVGGLRSSWNAAGRRRPPVWGSQGRPNSGYRLIQNKSTASLQNWRSSPCCRFPLPRFLLLHLLLQLWHLRSSGDSCWWEACAGPPAAPTPAVTGSPDQRCCPLGCFHRSGPDSRSRYCGRAGLQFGTRCVLRSPRGPARRCSGSLWFQRPGRGPGWGWLCRCRFAAGCVWWWILWAPRQGPPHGMAL